MKPDLFGLSRTTDPDTSHGVSGRLRHATPARNLPSILRRGILAARARGGLRTVWVCSPSLVWWAVLHTAGRHKVSSESVAVLEVDVPRAWLKRHGKRG